MRILPKFLVFLIHLQLCATIALGQSKPEVAPRYQRMFAHYSDNRSILEKALNVAGLTNEDVGRSFALIAGASNYPNMPPGQRYLKPSEADREALKTYLRQFEYFDEIVVLWNSDMNIDNLTYFLQVYFPKRLQQFPRSRFLFAYSGHGFTEDGRSYLLKSTASKINDRTEAINIKALRILTDEVVDRSFYTLVLINSCYAGAFLTRTSFGHQNLPKHPGAHAISAGGSMEVAWHDQRYGDGSIFFEKLLSGLNGRADSIPQRGDGLITTEELFAYLRQEVQISTDQAQNPLMGDISRDGSLGSFFFLNRQRQITDFSANAAAPSANKVRMGDDIIPAENKPLSPTSQAAYDKGYTLYHQGKFAEAETFFDTFLNAWPTSELADNALYWIGEARYAQQDYTGAESAFRGVLVRYPEGNRVPESLSKLGNIFELTGDIKRAIDAYDILIKKFPNTAAATAAETRKSQLAQPALLFFDINPLDASVYVNHKFIGQPSDIGLFNKGVRVDPGKVMIAIVRPGYEAVEQIIEIKPGEVKTIKISLRRPRE